MVKGSVTISIEDFQELLETSNKAKEFRGKAMIASKEMQVFLSFLCSREDISKYIEEFNRQSQTSTIIIEGSQAKIDIKDEE